MTGSNIAVTRRQFLAASASAALGAVVASCSASPTPSAATSAGATQAAPSLSLGGSATPSTPAPSLSSSGLDEAALRRRVASLLVVGFRGQQVSSDHWIVRAIERGLGGVILFDRDQLTGARRNIISPEQLRRLVDALRSVSDRLIVAVDQEGGRVARLNPGNGFPATQSEAEIGALGSTSTALTWGSGIADMLSSAGIGLNFAPVVDLDLNPRNPAIGLLGRSFSADPDVVVAMAAEELRAHRAAGVRTSLKHFPGFGSATGNTDFGVVDVTGTWRRIELEPFRQLVRLRLVDSVMVAHLLNHELDPELPASLSRAVVNDMLRVELGWDGAVVSDDMQAAAITRHYGRTEAVAMALQAGVDMLVFANQQVYDEGVVEAVVDDVVARVRDGRLDQHGLERSVARVDALRP